MRRNTVKSSTVVGLLIASLASPADAQRLSVGGRIGVVASHAMFQDEINDGRTDPRIGLQIGGVAEWDLSRYVAVRAEALYTEKGWSEFNTGGGRRFGYVEFPIVLVLRLPFLVDPHVSVGSFVAFEVSCAVTGVPVDGSVPCDDPAVTTARRRADYGVVAGLGLGHRLFRGRLLADLTVMLGLHDLNRESLPPGYLRLGTLSLTARYMLPAGG